MSQMIIFRAKLFTRFILSMYLQETLDVLPSLKTALPKKLTDACLRNLLIGDKSTRRQGLLKQELPVLRDAVANANHQE